MIRPERGLGWSRLPLGDFAHAWRAERGALRQALRDQELRDLAMGCHASYGVGANMCQNVPTLVRFQAQAKLAYCSLLKKGEESLLDDQCAAICFEMALALQSNCQRIHFLSPLNHEHVIVHVRSALDVFISFYSMNHMYSYVIHYIYIYIQYPDNWYNWGYVLFDVGLQSHFMTHVDVPLKIYEHLLTFGKSKGAGIWNRCCDVVPVSSSLRIELVIINLYSRSYDDQKIYIIIYIYICPLNKAMTILWWSSYLALQTGHPIIGPHATRFESTGFHQDLRGRRRQSKEM